MTSAQRQKLLTLIAAVATVAALAGGAVAFIDEAAAVSQSRVRPLDSVGLPADVAAGVARAAARAGGRDVYVVTPSAVAGTPTAGVYASRRGGGEEVVAFFSPHAFTSFVAAREILGPRDLFVATAAQPDAPGGTTAHVQLRGVVGPAVALVAVEQADGEAIDADLVTVQGGKYRFFTYVSDDAQRLPTRVVAYGSNGNVVASDDVSRAVAPPTS